MFAVTKDLIGDVFGLAYVLAVRRGSGLRLSHRVQHQMKEIWRSRCVRKRTVDHNTPRDYATYTLHVTSQTDHILPVLNILKEATNTCASFIT